VPLSVAVVWFGAAAVPEDPVFVALAVVPLLVLELVVVVVVVVGVLVPELAPELVPVLVPVLVLDPVPLVVPVDPAQV
jgi:hypothetical protein